MLSAENAEPPAGAADQGAPIGPSADEEAAFLAEQPAASPAFNTQPSALSADSVSESAGTLPPLEDLVKLIPMLTRDLLEELFRAKFVTVKRVPQSALK